MHLGRRLPSIWQSVPQRSFAERAEPMLLMQCAVLRDASPRTGQSSLAMRCVVLQAMTGRMVPKLLKQRTALRALEGWIKSACLLSQVVLLVTRTTQMLQTHWESPRCPSIHRCCTFPLWVPQVALMIALTEVGALHGCRQKVQQRLEAPLNDARSDGTRCASGNLGATANVWVSCPGGSGQPEGFPLNIRVPLVPSCPEPLSV